MQEEALEAAPASLKAVSACVCVVWMHVRGHGTVGLSVQVWRLTIAGGMEPLFTLYKTPIIVHCCCLSTTTGLCIHRGGTKIPPTCRSVSVATRATYAFSS